MIDFPTGGRPPGPPRTSALEGIDLGRLLRERSRTLAHFAAQTTPLTRVVPIPRALVLGDGPRVVGELRVCDLAALQAWLEDAEPDPLEETPPAWDDPDQAGRPARLWAAWTAAATWPIRLGTDRSADLLGTKGGRAYLLSLALARGGDPVCGLADALELIVRVTPTQWDRLIRVAYGVSVRESIAAELAPDPAPPRPVDYGRLFDQILEHRGLTYEQSANLTLSQFRILCAAGKPVERSEEYGAMCSRVRAFFRKLGFGA